jgi:hypothetical protein
MDNIYEMFRPVFGIVASVFILYFLVNYAGSYGLMQQDYQKTKIASNLLQTGEEVYLSGNPEGFTDLEKYDFSSCHQALSAGQEVLSCDFNHDGMAVTVPIMASVGQDAYLERGSLDMGWWRFDYVAVTPEMRVVFNPVVNTEQTRRIIKDLASRIPSPSGEAVDVAFSFCSGTSVTAPADRPDFLDSVDSIAPISFSKCSARPEPGDRYVALAGSCAGSRGVCLDSFTAGGLANIYVEGSDRAFLYKDPLDGLAMLLGYTNKDAFGKTFGEDLYECRNVAFMQRLSVAARAMSERASILAAKLPEGSACAAPFGSLSVSLDAVASKAAAAADGGYASFQDMSELSTLLTKAMMDHGTVMGLGCDYAS